MVWDAWVGGIVDEVEGILVGEAEDEAEGMLIGEVEDKVEGGAEDKLGDKLGGELVVGSEVEFTWRLPFKENLFDDALQQSVPPLSSGLFESQQ